MLKKNDVVELTVTDMSFEGMGVARYSDEDVKGFVVFIHNGLRYHRKYPIAGRRPDCAGLRLFPKMRRLHPYERPL